MRSICKASIANHNALVLLALLKCQLLWVGSFRLLWLASYLGCSWLTLLCRSPVGPQLGNFSRAAHPLVLLQEAEPLLPQACIPSLLLLLLSLPPLLPCCCLASSIWSCCVEMCNPTLIGSADVPHVFHARVWNEALVMNNKIRHSCLSWDDNHLSQLICAAKVKYWLPSHCRISANGKCWRMHSNVKESVEMATFISAFFWVPNQDGWASRSSDPVKLGSLATALIYQMLHISLQYLILTMYFEPSTIAWKITARQTDAKPSTIHLK